MPTSMNHSTVGVRKKLPTKIQRILFSSLETLGDMLVRYRARRDAELLFNNRRFVIETSLSTESESPNLFIINQTCLDNTTAGSLIQSCLLARFINRNRFLINNSFSDPQN